MGIFDIFRSRIRNRAIVLSKSEKDGNYRWRCVEVPAELQDSDRIDESECRTAFLDTAQDAYASVKPVYNDARREMENFCDPDKLTWMLEENGVLNRCSLADGLLVLPTPE